MWSAACYRDTTLLTGMTVGGTESAQLVLKPNALKMLSTYIVEVSKPLSLSVNDLIDLMYMRPYTM